MHRLSVGLMDKEELRCRSSVASPHHHPSPAAPTEGLSCRAAFLLRLAQGPGKGSDNFGFKSRLQQVLAL